jgi:PiT family inorganic phosphate transporter
VGALFGMGVATRKVHWRKVGEILLAWVITVPCGAVLAATSYALLQGY